MEIPTLMQAEKDWMVQSLFRISMFFNVLSVTYGFRLFGFAVSLNAFLKNQNKVMFFW